GPRAGGRRPDARRHAPWERPPPQEHETRSRDARRHEPARQQEGNRPMNQATATARPLRAPARSPRRATPPRLGVLPARMASTGNGAFASIGVVLLVAGLVALLLLNAALAQGSLELGRRQRESAVLAETAGNLQEEIGRASASGALAKKAS